MAKILLVEDDNNLREIYGERLMAEGYDILSASDGEEALQTAVNEKPDLIISDVMMPKISGFDMLDILRQTPETKDIKIIMMTALSQAEDKSRADRLGANKYLVKSQVTLEDVARVVHDILDDNPNPSDSTSPDTPPQTIASSAMELPEPVVAPQTVAQPALGPVPEPTAPSASATATPQIVATTIPISQPAPVPEPVATPVPEPVAAIPEPVATPQPISQPAPDPMQVTIPEPTSQPAPATEPVTVAQPIPAPAPEPTAVAPTTPPASLAQNMTNPISGTATSSATTTSEPPTVNTDSLGTSIPVEEELQEVEKQIDSFVASNIQPENTQQSPVQEPSEQDIIHANNAQSGPQVVSSAPPEKATIPPLIPTQDNMYRNPEPAQVRKKVIEPVSGDGGLNIPNINELYEEEMAHEAEVLKESVPNSGTIISAGDQTQNPIANQADFAPPPLETIDINSVSGSTSTEEIPPANNQPVIDTAPANPTAQPTPPLNPNDPNNFAL
jgi:CheY-like chemotaxis protein